MPLAEPILPDLRAGQTLGRYELLMPLARGGMAIVWAARLRGTRGFEKLVAIKTMLPDMSDDAGFEQMFLDEAKLAARVRSPHVVETLDLGEERGVLYIVMEWVDGEPLNEIMRAASRLGPMPLDVCVSIIMQACAGLHVAHELKDEQGQRLELVHRDISPHNVLVGYDGIAKVTDFGIAKAMALGVSSTQVGEVKGKTAYMSPEQAIGGALDCRSDVFALGVVLYQLSTGTHPFRGQTDGETIANIVLPDPPRRPTSFVQGYPPELERVVLKALAKEVGQRHRTASALLDDLHRAMPGSGMGYEKIGSYVESLLGSRRAERSAKLKGALAASESRSTTPSFESLPAVAAGEVTQYRRRGGSRAALIGGVLVVLGLGGVLFAVQGSHAEGNAAAVEVPLSPSAALADEPLPGPAKENAPAAAAGPDPAADPALSASPSASAQGTAAPAGPNDPAPRPRKSAPRAAPPPAKPAAPRAPSPNVSPVRTPGF
jgi:eukaryotic-like serine/threonine-protein kinase